MIRAILFPVDGPPVGANYTPADIRKLLRASNHVDPTEIDLGHKLVLLVGPNAGNDLLPNRAWFFHGSSVALAGPVIAVGCNQHGWESLNAFGALAAVRLVHSMPAAVLAGGGLDQPTDDEICTWARGGDWTPGQPDPATPISQRLAALAFRAAEAAVHWFPPEEPTEPTDILAD